MSAPVEHGDTRTFEPENAPRAAAEHERSGPDAVFQRPPGSPEQRFAHLAGRNVFEHEFPAAPGRAVEERLRGLVAGDDFLLIETEHQHGIFQAPQRQLTGARRAVGHKGGGQHRILEHAEIFSRILRIRPALQKIGAVRTALKTERHHGGLTARDHFPEFADQRMIRFHDRASAELRVLEKSRRMLAE